MKKSLQSAMFLSTMLLLATIVRSDDTAIQPEVEDENLRHLHQDSQREWLGQDIPVVFPEDSSVAGLALPGSQPIRSRNPYRRRRKRPRPQPPQEEIQPSTPSLLESSGTVELVYTEQTPHYQLSQQEYYIPQTPDSNDGNVKEFETPVFHEQQHQSRPYRRRPYSQRQKPYPQELPQVSVKGDSSDTEIKKEENVYQGESITPEEEPLEISQEEQNTNSNDSHQSNSQSFVEENSYTNKRHRGDYREQQTYESSLSDIASDGFRPKQYTRNNLHHKPYSTRSQEQNNRAITSPQDIKALLKQQSGSLSLSEVLQQKNLSLADLLKGNHNALSALSSTHDEALGGKTADTNQESSYPRRLPPTSTNSRRKSQNTGNQQKPQRYSAKQDHISEEHGLQSSIPRRLPPANTPSRRNPSLPEGDKLVRYQVEEQEHTDLDRQERINKFKPSSPRRPSTLLLPDVPSSTDNILTSTTQSIEVTNSIISDSNTDEHQDKFPDSISDIQNEERFKTRTEENRKGNLVSRTSTTENNIISNSPITESPHLILQESNIKSQELTTEQRHAPIPLIIQETSVIDPLHNSPEVDNMDHKFLDHNRLRGKYNSRHRISVAQKNNNSKVESTKSGRLRLPPPNLFLSAAVRPKIISQVTSTNESNTTTTAQPVQFITTSSQTSTTIRTVALTAKAEESHTMALDSTAQVSHLLPPQTEYDDLVPRLKVLTTEHSLLGAISTATGNESDEPMHKVIPFYSNAQSNHSQRLQDNNRTQTTSARDEILEFLKTDTSSVRLARILASRNMSLAELIEHRERGSSQQHLAEIFRESEQSTNYSTEVGKSETDDNQSNHNTFNNELMYSILRNFQQNSGYTGNSKETNNIPRIQEMFGFTRADENQHSQTQKHGSDHSTNQEKYDSSESTSSQEQTNSEDYSIEINKDLEGQVQQTSSRELHPFDSLPSFAPSSPSYHIPPVSSHRPSNHQPFPIPAWKTTYQHPATIYSFDPTNPYFSSGRRPIITSRLTTPTPITPLISNDIKEDIVLLENIGQVREIGSTGVGNNKRPTHINRDEDKRFDILYTEDNKDDNELSDGGLPSDVKSAIIVSSAILGLAILGFLAIFVVCRWRQRQARRRFVDGIVNARAHSPILMQPEEKDPRRSLSPVMVNTRDLYKRDVSLDGEEDNMNPSTRRYYLWRTIRKTLRYK